MRFLTILLALAVFLPGCRSAFVPKKQIEAVNQEYDGRRFRTREDLYLQQNEVIDKAKLIHKKGVILELRIESSDDWVRVRGRDVSRSAEQNPGEVFLFLVDDPEKEQTGDQVLSEMKRILTANLAPVP